MKYTNEQLKDILYLVENSCRNRSCTECRWDQVDRNNLTHRSCFWIKEPVFLEIVVDKVQEGVREELERILFSET